MRSRSLTDTIVARVPKSGKPPWPPGSYHLGGAIAVHFDERTAEEFGLNLSRRRRWPGIRICETSSSFSDRLTIDDDGFTRRRASFRVPLFVLEECA